MYAVYDDINETCEGYQFVNNEDNANAEFGFSDASGKLTHLIRGVKIDPSQIVYQSMPKIPMTSTMCMNAAKNNKADTYLYSNNTCDIGYFIESLPTPSQNKTILADKLNKRVI